MLTMSPHLSGSASPSNDTDHSLSVAGEWIFEPNGFVIPVVIN